MSDIWFTSDTHYDHVNIIEYCDRPFARDITHGSSLMRPSEIDTGFEPDIQAMNETMVERWNAVVKAGDEVYHLGDVMLGPGYTLAQRLRTLRMRLAGRITLILGNHDRGAGIYRFAGFDRVERQASFGDPRVGLVHMAHHPPRVDSGNFELCGHVHERWLRKNGVINVGVDQWNFAPVHFETIVALAENNSL